MIAWLFSGVIIASLVVYHGFNFLMVVLAWFELRRQRLIGTRRTRVLAKSGATPGVAATLPGIAVIVPAFNESVSIVRTVGSILRSAYPHLQVIVVSDGSTDRTLSVLTDAFALRPSNARPNGSLPTQNVRAVFVSETDARLLVVDKRNGGKADALNVGLNMASQPLVLATDADVVFDAHALLYLALPFALHPNTVATSGMIRLYNGCTVTRNRVARVGVPRTLLELCQVVEYLRAYGIGRLFFNRLGGHLIISGAFGLFDRQLLLELGGYQAHAVGEDMELVARIHRHCLERNRPYRIEFSAHALCYTEAPHTRLDFGKQRTRWHHGLLTTLRIHRHMAFNPRYGSIGLVTFPYFVLELYAPALEAIGWLSLPVLWLAGLIPFSTVFLFAAVSVLMSMAVSLAAIVLDAIYFGHFRRASDRMAIVAAAIVEPFWYRPFTVYYRLRAFYRYYRTIHLKTAWKSPARAAQPAPVGDTGRR
jgi:cellulose synthase/poly-beta-1,6-N-acetylglucosamine synthase-like glycosyltransferase